MPYPAFVNDFFLVTVEFLLPLAIMLSFIFSFGVFVKVSVLYNCSLTSNVLAWQYWPLLVIVIVCLVYHSFIYILLTKTI